MNYPQIGNEALETRYGFKKLKSYMYGRPLVIETAHRPLETISKKPLGRAATRLQSLLFGMQHYVPEIVYKRGKYLHITHLLSRDYETNENADAFTQDLEVLAILPMAEDAFRELHNSGTG